MAYLQGTSSWDDTVRLSKESSPVVKVFSAAAACLATMGRFAVTSVIGQVDMKMAENSKELSKEINMLTKEVAEHNKKLMKEVTTEIRYIALVMTERRLTVVEAKLGVPNGRPLLPPPIE